MFDEKPIMCIDKMHDIRKAFSTAVEKLGSSFIASAGDIREERLVRAYAYVEGWRDNPYSMINLSVSIGNALVHINLDDAKELLKHLTTIVKSADALENKYLKLIEENKKAQQEATKNSTSTFEF